MAASSDSMQRTEHGIPIRNVWHMLLYAWEDVPLKSRGMFAEVERAPTLDGLLASILMRLMQGRLRIGLGGDYVARQGALRGIRGHIDFSKSLKQRTFEHGEAYCEYEQYSVNAARNQIIRSTLARLIQTGQFGPEAEQANALRHRLRHLAGSLDGIDLIELTPELIHRQRLSRNDNDYRIMLEICWLLRLREMPTESAGVHPLPAVDRDALVLHHIYERFVSNFYRAHLEGWIVTPQKRLEWHEKSSTPYLPSMIPDLVLQETSTDRMILLDTKFTAHSLTPNRWGKEMFDSAHLYQLYAYLKSQAHVSEAHQYASGILLYPVVHRKLSERIELPDHVMRVESVDLTLSWQEIERQLLDLIHSALS